MVPGLLAARESVLVPAQKITVSPELLAEAYAQSKSGRNLAKRLGIRQAETARLVAERAGYEIPAPHWAHRSAPTISDDLTPEEAHAHDVEVLALKAKLGDLQRKYNVACKTESLHDDVLGIAREVLGRIPAITPAAPHVGSGGGTEDAILGLADFHFGEVIDYDVMQGYNAYDPVVACRRIQYCVDTTLDLLFTAHQGTTFERLYVFGLGDLITGDLLPDNMATNALGVFQSMHTAAHIVARALCELGAHIPVVFVGVPGNHGRRQQKMPWKQPTETADWLIGEMIRDLCADNPRVTVNVPKAWTAGVTVRGWNHSLNHGYSAAKGGYGGIPWYAFQRADGKKTALESAHGKRVHFRWYGHIHTPAELPKMDGAGSQFIVGSLKGGDEYALEELNAYGDPTQLLVGCHEKIGVSFRYPLQPKHGDDTPSRYEEMLP